MILLHRSLGAAGVCTAATMQGKQVGYGGPSESPRLSSLDLTYVLHSVYPCYCHPYCHIIAAVVIISLILYPQPQIAVDHCTMFWNHLRSQRIEIKDVTKSIMVNRRIRNNYWSPFAFLSFCPKSGPKGGVVSNCCFVVSSERPQPPHPTRHYHQWATGVKGRMASVCYTVITHILIHHV